MSSDTVIEGKLGNNPRNSAEKRLEAQTRKTDVKAPSSYPSTFDEVLNNKDPLT